MGRMTRVEISLVQPVWLFPHSFRMSYLLGRVVGRRLAVSNLVPARYGMPRRRRAVLDDASRTAVRIFKDVKLWVEGAVYIAGGDVAGLEEGTYLIDGVVLAVKRVEEVEVEGVAFPWNHVAVTNKPSPTELYGRFTVPRYGYVVVCHLTRRGRRCAEQPLVYNGEQQVEIETIRGVVRPFALPFPGALETLQFYKWWLRVVTGLAH